MSLDVSYEFTEMVKEALGVRYDSGVSLADLLRTLCRRLDQLDNQKPVARIYAPIPSEGKPEPWVELDKLLNHPPGTELYTKPSLAIANKNEIQGTISKICGMRGVNLPQSVSEELANELYELLITKGQPSG